MKRTVTIVAVIAALGIAVFAFSGRDRAGTAATGKDPADAPGRLPARVERIDDEHAPERFDSLDDEVKALALELEKAAIKWNRNRPKDEGFHQLTNDWWKYSLERISALSTDQIRQLYEWMGEGTRFASELYEYRQAIITIWSSREPEEVRARLMEFAKATGSLDEDVSTFRNDGFARVVDAFHHAYVGLAMKDPKAAWEAFLKDDADLRMKHLINGRTIIAEIFKEYAAQLPGEAWSLALATQDDGHSIRMVEGFADGAPAGQNWEEKGRELTDSLAARGIEASQWPFRSIGERWLMEDPVAALDWFARCAPEDALRSAGDRLVRGISDDPFAEQPTSEPAIDPAEVPLLLKTDLLVEMYGSYKDRTRETVAALDHLNKHGEDQVVVAALGNLVGVDLYPTKIPLLEVISGIPIPEDRNTLFLQAVHAIPIRNNDDPFASPDSLLDAPNTSLIAVRELAARLDLPEEIRAEAEAAFRNLEEQELKALQESKRKPSDDDPFR